MTTEEEAQLRHLMRKGKELPMPISHLLKLVSGRPSRFAPVQPSLTEQAARQRREVKSLETFKAREEAMKQKQEQKEQREKEKKIAKEEKIAKRYNERESKRVERLIRKKFKNNPEKIRDEIQEMRDRGWDKYRI